MTIENDYVYVARSEVLKKVLFDRSWCQEGAADELGVSRTYFNLLVNRRRPLTPQMRRRFLQSDIFGGVAEDQLWERVPADEFEASRGKAKESP